MTEKYASPVSTHYHVDLANCPVVHQPDRHVERSQEHIEFNELEPCPHCVTESVNGDLKNKGKSISNLAKSIKYGTERQSGD